MLKYYHKSNIIRNFKFSIKLLIKSSEIWWCQKMYSWRKWALKNAVEEIAKAAKIVHLTATAPRRAKGMDKVISISISIQRRDAQIRSFIPMSESYTDVTNVVAYESCMYSSVELFLQRHDLRIFSGSLGLIRTHNEWNFVSLFDVVSSRSFEWFLSKLSAFIIHFVFGMNFKRIFFLMFCFLFFFVLFWIYVRFFTNLNAITSISIVVFFFIV